mmetsp:Transcript_31404/g.100903  ORF Transcript_31404/g.100903 Transcript_31404/m.100903 type:complete len:244 (+) Transcript_31404:745-1476(+)
MFWSLAMCCTASFARSSRSTLGWMTVRYLSNPPGDIISLSSVSGVPLERMSASMTANFCFATSTTMSGGSGVSATRSARTFSISSFMETADTRSETLRSFFCCCCCCCCCAVKSVSSILRSMASRVAFMSLASSSGLGTARRLTLLSFTSNISCFPASKGCRLSWVGMSTGMSTTVPAFCPTRASTTPGKNLPSSRIISRLSPPTETSNGLPFSFVSLRSKAATSTKHESPRAATRSTPSILA